MNLGQSGAPVSCMTAIHGRLWCGCHCNVVVVDTSSLEVEVRKFFLFVVFSVFFLFLETICFSFFNACFKFELLVNNTDINILGEGL